MSNVSDAGMFQSQIQPLGRVSDLKLGGFCSHGAKQGQATQGEGKSSGVSGPALEQIIELQLILWYEYPFHFLGRIALCSVL